MKIVSIENWKIIVVVPYTQVVLYISDCEEVLNRTRSCLSICFDVAHCQKYQCAASMYSEKKKMFAHKTVWHLWTYFVIVHVIGRQETRILFWDRVWKSPIS